MQKFVHIVFEFIADTFPVLVIFGCLAALIALS